MRERKPWGTLVECGVSTHRAPNVSQTTSITTTMHPKALISGALWATKTSKETTCCAWLLSLAFLNDLQGASVPNHACDLHNSSVDCSLFTLRWSLSYGFGLHLCLRKSLPGQAECAQRLNNLKLGKYNFNKHDQDTSIFVWIWRVISVHNISYHIRPLCVTFQIILARIRIIRESLGALSNFKRCTQWSAWELL